jgi:hypothetical protein
MGAGAGLRVDNVELAALEHEKVEGIVAECITTCEFIQIPTAFVRQAIAGILVRALPLSGGGPRRRSLVADQVALLLLRGLLTDPGCLEEVRRPVSAGTKR